MHSDIERARRLARLLDSEFRIFSYRFGLDPILGLVPGLGDLATMLLGLYIVRIAQNANAPAHILRHMFAALVLDLAMGAIPFVGDLGDFVFRANNYNIKLLESHLRKTGRLER